MNEKELQEEELPTIQQLSFLFFEWLERMFEVREINTASITTGFDEDLERSDNLCIIFTSRDNDEDKAFIVWEDNFPDKFGYFLDYAEDELEDYTLSSSYVKDLIKEKDYSIAKREDW